MISRSDKTHFSEWWWTIDRWLLGALSVLIILGMVLIWAGGPSEADRLHLPPFYFVDRQISVIIPATVVMLLVSFFSPRQVRRAALITYIVAMAMIFLALFIGIEVKGSRRWIFGIQPSEFLKPAFVILAAWAFSEGAARKQVPGNFLALILLPATIVPLVLQPDFGQTMLISLVWAALFFMAGVHWLWVAGIGGIGATSVIVAYKFVPHVRARILSFLEPNAANGATNTFQVDTALNSFISGGWFGKGPGEGTVKRFLPDGHTDFIFAVTGEEFGIIFCLFIVSLFAFIVLRGLLKSANNGDPFCRFAGAGLVMQFGLQSCINIAVNLHLMPAKGMTLPFISYGGSSLLSLALGMGFLIAVTRRRPTVGSLGADASESESL